MRAFQVEKHGQPLHEVRAPEPTAGEHDVLVQVAAASLNHLDEKLRTGEFRLIAPTPMPLTLGHDLAGTVVEVGSQVQAFRPGDLVFARPRDGRVGTFAERIAVHADDVALAPASVGPVEAASLPLVALTAWQALVERADVQPGQKVLVHAGAGGVGTVAVQLAKHLGAHVATTVSADGADFVRDLGADVVVDHRTQRFEEVLSGYDVVVDGLGPESVARSLRVLRPGGRVIGLQGPPDPAFARAAGLGPVVRLAIAGLSRSVRRQAAARGVSYEFLWMRADGEQLRRIAELVDTGAVRPVVGATHPFDDTAEALASLGRTRIRGKAVVVLP